MSDKKRQKPIITNSPQKTHSKNVHSMENMIRTSPFQFTGEFETKSSLSDFEFWSGKRKINCTMTTSSTAIK